MSSAHGQEDERSLIRFAGVVQFVSGKVERLDNQKRGTELVHANAIYEGDLIRLEKDATLKLITRSHCILVLHGEGLAQAPDREKPWRIRAHAFRAICNQGEKETLSSNRTRFQISDGEVLSSDTNVLVLRGNVRAGSTELTPMQIFERDDRFWKPARKREPIDAWNFNQRFKAPKESLALAKPSEKQGPAKLRFTFGPVFGGSGVTYNVEALDENDLSTNGGRLQAAWQKGKGSIVTAFSFSERQSEAHKGENNGPLKDGVYSRLNTLLLEGGYRFDHARWWSFYARGGTGIVKSQVQIARSDLGYYSRHEYSFLALSAAGGIDFIYSPLSWLGLYAGAEFQIIRSVFSLGDETLDSSSAAATTVPDEAEKPADLTTGGINIMLGLTVQF